MPKPSKPHFPEVKIDESPAEHPALKNFGQLPNSPSEAVNYFAKMKFEAGEIESPYGPYPDPKLTGEPGMIPDAESK